MTKKRVFVGAATILLFALIGCSSSTNLNQTTNGMTVNTEDISQSGYYFNLESGNFENTWDLKFELSGMNYLVSLNNAAGVCGKVADTSSFSAATLPSTAFRSDTTTDQNYLIGGDWMDLNTYNPTDHSIQGNGQVYFIRTSNYEIIKLRILSGSPSTFVIEYAIDNDGFSTPDTAEIPYTSDSPAYFDFTSGSTMTPSDWDLGILTQPVYAEGFGTVYMPTIQLNSLRNVRVDIVTDQMFSDLVELPTDTTWISDSGTDHPLGYEGSNEVLVYHPEPPYNHKVIIENPDYVYLFETPDGFFRLTFDDYGSGAVVFTYDKF